MQSQSEINNKCKLKNQQQPRTPTTRNTTTKTIGPVSILQENPTTTTAAATATAREVTKRSSAVKVVKCKKPLCHFKFYLDIRDHQLTKRIEEQIKLLGGTLEFFLTPRVTHFITDKEIINSTITTNNNNTNNSHNLNISCPTTPQTPQTPHTPYSLECLADSTKSNNGLTSKKPIRNSRADAILNRARRQSTITVSTPTTSRHSTKVATVEQTTCVTPLKHKEDSCNNDTDTQQFFYVVWQCEVAFRFFKKVQHELKDYLNHSNKLNSKTNTLEAISLKGSFIKFESLKRNFRPYYHLFKKPQEWPKIQLSREDGAFRLSPKKDLPLKEVEVINKIPQALHGGVLVDNMTRKSRTKSSQNHHNKLKNKDNDLIKSPANSQKQSAKCKNQTPQHQKDSSDKQCGVCEICKIEYDALTLHLKTKDHEYFAKNSQNFMALDSLIHSSADVNKFLDENRKLEIKTELDEMEVEHEGLIINEQDPLQSSEDENENQNGDDDNNDDNDDNGVDDYDDDDGSQKSSSYNKHKSVESKIVSPTLREKSKRSTKGKHSSEKFKNCSFIKAPKTPSPQKTLVATDVKTSAIRKKPSTAAISPPIRAMLPPSSMYKVVETHTELNCSPARGKGLAAGLSNNSKVMGSPSIIVKFKKVRTTELQVLNGEAENFMFPKKRSDSSELLTDIDRQTTSDRLQPPQSSQQSLTSSSSSEDQDPDEDFDVKDKPQQVVRKGKKAIIKAKRRLSKVCKSSTSKSTLGGEIKQSFPKTPIQPKEQLKTKSKPTSTTTAKRKSKTASRGRPARTQNMAEVMTVSNKIVLPEATRKSSRTATAIVTAATTSTRLLQAAVEAAKSKHKLETSKKSRLPKHPLPSPQYLAPIKMQIKQELNNDSDQDKEDENDDGNDVKHKTTAKSKKLRYSHISVVKMEDRMGDINKKPQNLLNKGKIIHGFDADDYEDEDDITIDSEDDDEKDEDFIVQSSKSRAKLSSALTKKSAKKASSGVTAVQMTAPALKSVAKGKRCVKTTMQPNLSMREERLARRQSRLITQLQLELQTGFEEEHLRELPTPKFTEKKTEKGDVEKAHSKSPMKLPKPETPPKTSPVKSTTLIKQESSLPSRYFDYTKSERLKATNYAFERLPTSDLWYHVYKRQDNCEEKYFQYFGSTKYRKLPYELGPIPFDSTLLDHNKQKMCCKLCENGRLKKESDKAQKLHVRRDLQLELKSEPCDPHNNTNSLKSLEDHDYLSSGQDKHQQLKQIPSSHDQDQQHSKFTCSSYPVETKSYAHKHKKLHLLQRYRQELEQQEQMQRQKLEDKVEISPNDSREIKTEDVLQDCLPSRNDRAGSTHSNASSCASSTHTNCKSKKMRNKLLNKVSFLANLELPPRKSPREHASTLALVSCIIKQRQDSLSKPNSETDEPPLTPSETESKVLAMAAEKLSASEVYEKDPPKTPPPLAPKTSVESPFFNAVKSPCTRSQAATPIEELRFATEISETVKRMRRGRNKYDFSPPFVKKRVGRPSSARGRGRGGSNNVVNLFGSRHKVTTPTLALESLNQKSSHTTNTNLKPHTAGNSVTRGRRRRGRQKGYNNLPKNSENVLTSIRKTGSKKGVLEFEVDKIAIEALEKATTDYVNLKLLEWQIDKFLTLSHKEHENNLLSTTLNATTPPEEKVEENGDAENEDQEHNKTVDTVTAINDVVLITPPATDYFSSDFDLCDIINQSSERLQEEDDGVNHGDRRLKKFSIFNSVHLNKYYRKRKNPKSNRTGWPKAPKKKAVTRQQSIQDKIYFLQNGKIREENRDSKIAAEKKEINDSMAIDMDETTQEQTRESGVITPPYSDNDIEDIGDQNKVINEEYEESLLMEEDSQMDLNEYSQTANDDDDDDDNGIEEEEDDLVECGRVTEEDNETLADSVEDEEEQREQKADSDADADADIEEADDDEERNIRKNQVQQKCMDFNKKSNKKSKKIIPKIIENDDEDSYEPEEKRPRCQQVSPVDKVRINLLNPNAAHTSTPSTPFMRALRQTPQLNGSLGSCISPSEKAGDNSDIFTVSSDGLDTDMDLSNSHCQLRSTTNVAIDEEDQHHHHLNTSIHNNNNGSIATPRRKFDISKYAPTNAATCAAEAATAAVKSLAISQFLKKEVRVTCRRLRAPFRRFRYRR